MKYSSSLINRILPYLITSNWIYKGSREKGTTSKIFDEKQDISASRDLSGSLSITAISISEIGFVLPFAYVIMNFQIISRYLVPVMPALAILGSFAIVNLSTIVVGKGRLRKVVMVSIVIVAMLQSSIFYFFIVVPPTKQFTEGLNRVLVGMGKWLRDNAPPSSVIAVPDIGAVGYYSRRKILDLGGLVSPEINRIRREVDYEDMLSRGLYLKFHPQYLIDRSPVDKRFANVVIRNNRFIPLLEGKISSLGIRKKGPFIYVLYRIESISNIKTSGVH